MGWVVTLLTDFGNRDYYVAAMKGVILQRCPDLAIVDISHEVPPQDVTEAAFLLAGCRREFPGATVHLAVVDPGVGSGRKALALAAGGQFYVGPDNGIFTYVLREVRGWRAREITNVKLFRKPVSATFHGRDVFALAAAALACDFPFEEVGPPLDNPVELDLPQLEISKGKIKATVIHVDRFGNLVSDVRMEHLEEAGLRTDRMVTEIGGKRVNDFSEYYSAGPDGLFTLFGSGGYLEIAVKNGSAAQSLETGRGSAISISESGKQS